AIHYCVRFGPQFFLDTRSAVPEVHIIRGFEQYPGQAAEEDYLCIDGAMIECCVFSLVRTPVLALSER
ncbi:hypothetical protein DNV77_21325, partial [Salmonella enterica subsp. enterica]|nr:hypothetical protein [Salmonella enterica subsp. enterica]